MKQFAFVIMALVLAFPVSVLAQESPSPSVPVDSISVEELAAQCSQTIGRLHVELTMALLREQKLRGQLKTVQGPPAKMSQE